MTLEEQLRAIRAAEAAGSVPHSRPGARPRRRRQEDLSNVRPGAAAPATERSLAPRAARDDHRALPATTRARRPEPIRRPGAAILAGGGDGVRLRSPALARVGGRRPPAARPSHRGAGRRAPRLLAALVLLGAAVVLTRLRAHPAPHPARSTPVPALATPGARPSPMPPMAVDPALQALLDQLIDEDNGSTAIVVRNLRTGAGAAYHDQEVMASASLAKVPILYEVYRQLAAGTLHLDDRLTVTAESITGGAGVLQGRVGDQLTVAELLRLSVTISDNVAARLLMLRVGGAEAVNRSMDALGLSHTRLYSDDRPNTTTAAEMATLMAIVAAGGDARRLPDSSAPESLASLLALPQAQNWLADGVPGGVIVAHKSGQLPGVRNDAGILYTPKGPVVVVGLTADLANQDEAETFLTRLGHDVYQYFS